MSLFTLTPKTEEEAPAVHSTLGRGSQRLRPYQEECVEAVLEAIQGGLTRVLYVAATGTGKTTTFSEIVARLLEERPQSRILVIADRIEIIEQTHDRIKDHCQLGWWDIGMEIAERKASLSNRVIVGSIQTCYGGKRPHPAWRPTAIIVDESDMAAAPTYRKLASFYGVDSGECIYIGCTATPKRMDQLSLYAENVDGSPTMIEQKSKPPRPATYADSVFQRCVFEYPYAAAEEDGWLVGATIYTVRTSTSLDSVKTSMGDFAQGDLEKTVDNDRRTMEVISAWAEDCPERSTLVFCAGVEHASHAADLWREAGFTAAVVDGTTNKWERRRIFSEFRAGKIKVLCNFGVVTRGTDLPACSCIVNLRPTKSWRLFMQMQGRGFRPLSGLLDDLHDATPEERRARIASSAKPDCAIIDVVDLYKKHDICSAPAILDLPVKLDMQGHSLREAKKMLDKFKEVKDRVIGECPSTYQQLEARLEQVSAMMRSGAKTEAGWKAHDNGFRFAGVPPAYQADLLLDGDEYRLAVTLKSTGERILEKRGKPGHDFKDYLDKAADHTRAAIEKHEESRPKGTLAKLSVKQIAVLARKGHSRDKIDNMTAGYARKLIGQYVAQWRGMG